MDVSGHDGGARWGMTHLPGDVGFGLVVLFCVCGGDDNNSRGAERGGWGLLQEEEEG